MSTPPLTLPADFDKWDKPAAGGPPDTLPADFDKWDAAPQPQVSSPGLIDRLKSEAQAVYHHPGQALLGAAKQVPALVQSMLPSAGVMGEVPGADTSGKMQMPSIANAYNKASAAVTKATTPQTEAQQGGAHLATAASLAAPAVGLVKAGVEAIPTTEKASKLFGDVAKEANKIPVQLENSHDAAIRLMDWQKKTQLGPTLNKFLNRITNPKLGPLTYEESRDFYNVLNDVRQKAIDGSLRIPGPIKFEINRLVQGLKADIGNAAGQVGRAADYYKAMEDYHHAKVLQDWYETAKAGLIGGVKYGVPAGLTGYGIKKAIDVATK